MSGQPNLLTVSEITRRIKLLLEGGFTGVKVQGELSNFKRHTSGHLYFTLKDESAQIACVMWRSRAAGLTFTPMDGMKVVVSGRVTVYEVRGNYQIDAASMAPLGVGELQLAFEKLKQKLASEGLFDARRKKPLPPFPERIGIVTSPTGAVIHDLLNVLRSRFPGLTVILAPVRVQGAGAAQEIADALGDLNRYGEVDVIIIARGGGSLEDLWAFNEEVVARAIAASAIPTVSAVGHEIDFTIADFVADFRASTPSAAAASVVRDRRELLEILRQSCYTLRDIIEGTITSRRDTINHLLRSYAFNRPLDSLRQSSQRLDDLHRTMVTSAAHRIALLSSRVHGVGQRIASLNPELTLKRGYAIVLKKGTMIGSSTALHPRDTIAIKFHDGVVPSTVTDTDRQ